MTTIRRARPWHNALRTLALLLAAFAGSAQAAVYTGVWDPPFGAPFDNLGWRGSAGFVVPETCRPEGTADVSNAQSCDGQAQVTSAQVEFYDTRAANPVTLATLDFDPQSLLVGTLHYVNGALTQLSTSLSNAVLPSASLIDYGVGSTTSFLLQFTPGGPRLGYQVCANGPTSCTFGGFNDSLNFPPQFRITLVSASVPEPGTAGLGALALVALLAARRRAR